MNSSSLKARDIEALVYTQSPPQRRPRLGRQSRPTRLVSATLAAVTAITLAAATLVWALLRP
jgi:hypothetical protein